MPQRILIADDHPLMRSALRQAVTQAFSGVEIIEAARYEQLRERLAAGEEPDLVLLDLHMPGTSGFIGLMMLRSEHPAIPVIVVSAAEDPATIRRSIDYGASGFVPKSAPIGRVAEAILAVLEGQIWTPMAETAGESGDGGLAERVVNLTPQQLRVLAGMAEGKLNKQIAHEMTIAEQTVKDHVTVILRKLGASNRTQAIVVASQLSLRPPPVPE
ncbi:MAG: DNA-binding response regulator [Rhodovulum sulfidophilum]|uniref:DNA-binding response regulator n=1 Tax=Rhodovulum sulfidophilum TaxID=35806 RepID=A0A2W5N8V0_RHOSU|nr:MAG: DNA-binding response regulator [Rhodovulum sulfidophilum]